MTAVELSLFLRRGTMLKAVLPASVASLLFVLDDRPRTPEDINMYGGIPTLAVLPSTKEMKKLNRGKSEPRRTGRRA